MPVLYQLRVVLRDVSPLIWRRLLVQRDRGLTIIRTETNPKGLNRSL